MKDQQHKNQSPYIFNDKGTAEVKSQIIDAYNSGVIDREDGKFDHFEPLN